MGDDDEDEVSAALDDIMIELRRATDITRTHREHELTRALTEIAAAIHQLQVDHTSRGPRRHLEQEP